MNEDLVAMAMQDPELADLFVAIPAAVEKKPVEASVTENTEPERVEVLDFLF